MPIAVPKEVAEVLSLEADCLTGKARALPIDEERIDQGGQMALLSKYDRPLVLGC